LLCTQCKVAVPRNDLDSHLRASHKGVRKSTRDSIRDAFADVPAARITADLQPLPDGSPPSSFLVPARRGFYCPACPTFRSFHEREIRHHSIKVHRHNIKPTEVQKNACYLQGWIKRRVVQSTRYWIVDMSVESSPCCPDNHDQSNSPQQDAEAELLELEAEEEDRLCRDPEIVIHDDLETDEDSEWLRACLQLSQCSSPWQVAWGRMLKPGSERASTAAARYCFKSRYRALCEIVTAYATDPSVLDPKQQYILQPVSLRLPSVA
jgi:hypothetical protein